MSIPISKYNTISKKKLIVFTDGACINNGKRNAHVYFANGEYPSISIPLSGKQTNNRAELMGINSFRKV